MDERPILNLDGYFLALRRLTGNRCDFWVDLFNCNSSLEEDLKGYLSNQEIKFIDCSPIGYKEIDEVLEEQALSKLIFKKDSILKLFAWDIVEYIQMSYRLIKPEIDPISANQALLVNAESEFHGRYVYIVVPVQKKVIIVGLARRP